MEQNEQEVVIHQQTPKSFFETKEVAVSEENKPKMPPKPFTPSEVVEQIFNGAVVETVKNDDNVKREIVESAKGTIFNKTQAIKNTAEAEAKEAYFNNNKDACECFGFKEEKMLEKWAVKCMKFVYRILLMIYITIASFTLAPIIFILQRLKNAIKKTWLAIIIALCIYAIIYFVLPYFAIKGWIK